MKKILIPAVCTIAFLTMGFMSFKKEKKPSPHKLSIEEHQIIKDQLLSILELSQSTDVSSTKMIIKDSPLPSSNDVFTAFGEEYWQDTAWWKPPVWDPTERTPLDEALNNYFKRQALDKEYLDFNFEECFECHDGTGAVGDFVLNSEPYPKNTTKLVTE